MHSAVLEQFLATTTRLLTLILVTHQTWPLVIASISQERNHSDKGTVFGMSLKCSSNHQHTIPDAIPKGQFQW
jgi:hypothetical protein